MINNFTIRALATDDAVAYKKLRLQALTSNPEAFNSTLEIESKKLLASFIYEINYSKKLPIWGYYGIFLDHQLIGFCQIDKSFAAKKPHLAYLYNLYLDPDYRGQGLAKKLVTQMIVKIKSQQIERIFITYLAKNKPARVFYDRLGFKECGVSPKAIKDGNKYDDEVTMVLEI